jgi:nicotinamidase-related amidase/isocitrate/isopropylmalate dehydrogenase
MWALDQPRPRVRDNGELRSLHAGELIVGLAVGEGTGPELADVFRSAVEALAAAWGVTLRLVPAPGSYATFTGLLAQGLPATVVAARAEDDAATFVGFAEQLMAAGARVLFRTAINAQCLYRARERLQAIKVDHFTGPSGEILLVRDQTQGFYGGTNSDPAERDVIRRTCEFRRDRTCQVIDRALELAAALWGGKERVDDVIVTCKFHLLDTRFAEWVSDHGRRLGLAIKLYQPDTANRSLDRLRGRVLIVGANEWADIMDAQLALRCGGVLHDERFARNLYLAPAVDGLVEYQTAHGSADDLAGLDRVNPTATLRAAADLMERHGGCTGAVAALEQGLDDARASGCATPDRGGSAGTREVTATVLESCLRRLQPTRRRAATGPPAHQGEALVLIDLQNEYCARGGRFAERSWIDPLATAAAAARANELLAAAREAGVPVLHVRTTYEAGRLPAAVAARHRRRERATSLRPGSWEAAFFEVAPRPGEPVLEKTGYDAFVSTPLYDELSRRGVRRVVLAGVFTDVCIDAAARGAFDRGLAVSVARDATLALERRQDECLRFMERFYDAESPSTEELRRRWAPARTDAETGHTEAVIAP